MRERETKKERDRQREREKKREKVTSKFQFFVNTRLRRGITCIINVTCIMKRDSLLVNVYSPFFAYEVSYAMLNIHDLHIHNTCTNGL